MSAELAARRTAAAAVLADYTNGAATADPDALPLQASRLASMLGLVLAQLDAEAADARSPIWPNPETQKLAEVRGFLADFNWELGDRQYALEQIDGIVNGDGR